MKTRLEQVLERCLNGREIAVWGNPTRLMLRILKPYRYHIAERVNPQKHYVVTVNDDDLTDFLMDAQSEPFKYVDDYLTFHDRGGQLPFEWECYGVKIGRQTYFGERFVKGCRYGFIESMGHFTSINSSAAVQCDHQHNMIFMSDEMQEFFTTENKTRFKDRYLADPKNPYAQNKGRIRIGNDVWIGSYAFINASKVTSIGDGAIIGSGAVVIDNIPPYAIAVGVPARVKRYRFAPEMIETLLRVKWWDWSINEINANADALMSPDIFKERFGHR